MTRILPIVPPGFKAVKASDRKMLRQRDIKGHGVKSREDEEREIKGMQRSFWRGRGGELSDPPSTPC